APPPPLWRKIVRGARLISGHRGSRLHPRRLALEGADVRDGQAIAVRWPDVARPAPGRGVTSAHRHDPAPNVKGFNGRGKRRRGGGSPGRRRRLAWLLTNRRVWVSGVGERKGPSSSPGPRLLEGCLLRPISG